MNPEMRKALFEKRRYGFRGAKEKEKAQYCSYEPNPYKIEEVKVCMITARASNDGRRVTRNNSHFKRVSEGRNNQLDQDRWNFEAHECSVVSEEKSCDVFCSA